MGSGRWEMARWSAAAAPARNVLAHGCHHLLAAAMPQGSLDLHKKVPRPFVSMYTAPLPIHQTIRLIRSQNSRKVAESEIQRHHIRLKHVRDLIQAGLEHLDFAGDHDLVPKPTAVGGVEVRDAGHGQNQG